jgi:hypothetical protein
MTREILKLNPELDLRRIRAGQKILLPMVPTLTPEEGLKFLSKFRAVDAKDFAVPVFTVAPAPVTSPAPVPVVEVREKVRGLLEEGRYADALEATQPSTETPKYMDVGVRMQEIHALIMLERKDEAKKRAEEFALDFPQLVKLPVIQSLLKK